MELRLQPLRIPAGWLVSYNNGFWEVDPDPDRIPEADRLYVFKQDLLQVHNAGSNRLLDLGWYPDGDLEHGEYRVVLYEGDFRGRLIHEFRSRDRLDVIAEIERLLLAVSRDKL